MALTHCTECQSSISDRATACPHCGAPGSALVAARRPALSPTSRFLAVSCALIGLLWAFVLVLGTIGRVNGAYIMPAAQATRLYNETTMGLAGLVVVTLSVMLLVQANRRS